MANEKDKDKVLFMDDLRKEIREDSENLKKKMKKENEIKTN